MAFGKLNYNTGFDEKHFKDLYINQNAFEKNKIRQALTTQLMKTTNKSDRKIDIQFDLYQFNKRFEDEDRKKYEENKKNRSDDMLRPDEILAKQLPHKKPIEEIIVNIREVFYRTLEMLIDKQSPIPYLMSSPDRQFATAAFLIIIGGLLLLFSNLMINKDDK